MASTPYSMTNAVWNPLRDPLQFKTLTWET